MTPFGRWLCAVAALVAAVAPAIAAPAPAPAEEDAIATARRDYEAIKAAGAGAEQQKLALPRQELPQLDLKPGDEPLALPAMPTRKEETERLKKERPGRSPTWLLDAMKEPAPGDATSAGAAGQGENPGRLPGTEPEVKPGDFLANAAELSRESERTRRDVDGKSAAAEVKADVVNPLGAFMASWMTPRDLELLKPVSVRATEAGPGVGGPSGKSAAGSESFSLRDLAPPEVGAATAGDSPRNNPYLTDLAPFAPVTAAPQLNSLPPLEPVLHVPERPPSEPAATVVPTAPAADLMKAREDEKYFKQLKRF